MICRDCRLPVKQTIERGLGGGTYAVVWTSENGWVCPVTSNEHDAIVDDAADDFDPTPCCPDPGCPGPTSSSGCTFPGFAANH